MIIDGKKIAEEIKNSLKEEIFKSSKKLKLAIVQVGPVRDRISKKSDGSFQEPISNGIGDDLSNIFVKQKIKFAEEIGVKTRLYNLPAEISTSQLRKKMAEICHIKENDGVILQLPLPKQINTQYALNSIIPKKDVDILSSRSFGDFATGRSKILPPLVGVIKEIFERFKIDVIGKNVVVIGKGILVGKPIANYFINLGATVSVLNSQTLNPKPYTLMANIIISGVGKPHFIKPDMVRDGVIIIDAGTSPSTGSGRPGLLVGDVDPSVEKKASLFTSVPGGVGPITVAMVFRNLIVLSIKYKV